MRHSIYSHFFPHFKSFFLRKLVIVWGIIGFACSSAQLIHDENNSLFIAEGAVITQVAESPVTGKEKKALKKIAASRKNRWTEPSQKNVSGKKTETLRPVKDKLFFSAADVPERFALGRLPASPAVMNVNLKPPQHKIYATEKMHYLPFFQKYSYKHNTSYRESHKRFEMTILYFCRPPPFFM